MLKKITAIGAKIREAYLRNKFNCFGVINVNPISFENIRWDLLRQELDLLATNKKRN